MNDLTLLVLLDTVDEDAAAWPRSAHDEERVIEFMELYQAGGRNALPPIIVTNLRPEGKRLLVDGHHRIEAAYRLQEQTDYEWKSLPAIEYDATTVFEAYRQACRLSGLTAKPLTRKEMRAAVGRYLQERSDLSDKEIAREIGVSHTFVWEMRTGKINVDAPQSEPASSGTLTAEQAAERLMKGLESIRSGGLFLFNPVGNMGKVLAEAALRRYGNEALKQLVEMEQWTNAARRYAQDLTERQA